MDAIHSITNDAYAVFDAAVHYKLTNGTALEINARNVFDKEEVTCATVGGCQYISPRIITARMQYC